MFGYNVIFYILLDGFSTMPSIVLGPLRTFKLFLLVKSGIEKDFYFTYMMNLFNYIISHIQYEVNFLFVMNADQILNNSFLIFFNEV